MENNGKSYKCGLIMPIAEIDGCSSSHWDAVRLIIAEALDGTEYEVNLVSNSNDVGIIHGSIIQNIFSNEIVICDVSAKNPNVMFELGMRLAFNKPVVIIKDNFTGYSFDTSMIEHIGYPRDLNYHAITNFKTALKSKVISTHQKSLENNYVSFLNHFPMVTSSTLPVKELGTVDYIINAIAEVKDEVRSLRKIEIGRLKNIPKIESVHMQLVNILTETPNLDQNTFSGMDDPSFCRLCEEFYKHNRPNVILSATAARNFRGIVYKRLLDHWTSESDELLTDPTD